MRRWNILVIAIAVLLTKSLVSAGAEPVKKGALVGREGLVAEPLMAPGFLSSKIMGVGVSSDGTVYVTQTIRVNREEISLLQSKFLHEADMALTTVAQKKQWIEKNYSPRIAAAQRFGDQNGDKKVDVADLKIRSEKILTLKDKNNDGLFDAFKVYAEGFNRITTGTAQSVTPIDGHVYATIIPDLWKLTDTNGDGVADRKESLAHGFATHFGYGNHDLHSVVQGYDGMIYWSMGDRGLNVLTKEGHSVEYPHTGSIVRCNPDGSEFEVFASGLRNCQYFDFDNYGNMFAIDHDADFQGERERLVYIPEGSDSGWRCYYQYRHSNAVLRSGGETRYSPWLAEVMWKPLHKGQPSHFLPPIENSWNAPAAFSFQPGTALGGKYKDHFLLGGLNMIRAFKMVPDGASFKRQGEEMVVQALPGVQVLTSTFGPDGRLYFVLWYDLWRKQHGCTLWGLRNPKPTKEMAEVQSLLAKGFKANSVPELLTLLSHADRRIRMGAQFELVARREVGSLQKTALDEKSTLLPRIHALWGLGQLNHKDKDLLSSLCKSENAELRAQAARWAGDLRFDPEQWMPRLLEDPSPRVQMFAAITCGKLNSKGAIAPLIKMLVSADNKVPVLRHAGVSGLVGVATNEQLQEFATHPSEAVRVAAVVALRQLKAPRELVSFLDDKSELVVSDAVRAIYDEADKETFAKHPAALERVAAMLDPRRSVAINIRALAANRRLGTLAAVTRVAAFLKSPQLNRTQRVAALDSLASWSTATTLDPVDGRYCPVAASKWEHVEKGFGKDAVVLAADKDAVVSRRAIAILSKMKTTDETWDRVVRYVMEDKLPDSVREQWLLWLKKQDSKKFVKVATGAMSTESSTVRLAAARELTGLRQAAEKVKSYLLRTISKSQDVKELQNAVILLAKTPSPGPAMRQLVEDLTAGKISASIQLDVIEAAQALSTNDEALRKLLDQYDSQKKKRGLLAEFDVALEGGDPSRGHVLFLRDARAQCSKCHALKKTDKQVGPSLQGIGRRHTRAYLLESLINPNAKIVEGYSSVTLQLHDGKSVTGILMSETKDDTMLKLPDGSVKKFASSAIESRSGLISGMPDAKAVLSKRELRDLVAYLATLQQ